jgi:hypothetical protein
LTTRECGGFFVETQSGHLHFRTVTTVTRAFKDGLYLSKEIDLGGRHVRSLRPQARPGIDSGK